MTMRTPGDDESLAAGFLFTEGIIAGRECLGSVQRKGPNAVVARLNSGVALDPTRLDRHSFVSSSCGACGKPLDRGGACGGPPRDWLGWPRSLPRSSMACLGAPGRPIRVRSNGGIHASGLFDAEGRLLAVREDVGRHNALDKADRLRAARRTCPTLREDRPGQRPGELRVEQKAAIAGVPVLGAVELHPAWRSTWPASAG